MILNDLVYGFYNNLLLPFTIFGMHSTDVSQYLKFTFCRGKMYFFCICNGNLFAEVITLLQNMFIPVKLHVNCFNKFTNIFTETYHLTCFL